MVRKIVKPSALASRRITDDLHHTLTKLVSNDGVVLLKLLRILPQSLEQAIQSLPAQVIVVREMRVGLPPGQVYFISSSLE